MALIIDSTLPLIGSKPDAKRVEVCRSFSYKLNLENALGARYRYESSDFFASRKMECAAEAAEWVSQQIFEECVAEVRQCVARFIEQVKRRDSERAGAIDAQRRGA